MSLVWGHLVGKGGEDRDLWFPCARPCGGPGGPGQCSAFQGAKEQVVAVPWGGPGTSSRASFGGSGGAGCGAVSPLRSHCLQRKPAAPRPVLWSTIKVMFWWTVLELQICIWHISMPDDSRKWRHICGLAHTGRSVLSAEDRSCACESCRGPRGLSRAGTVPRPWGRTSEQRSLPCGTAVLVLPVTALFSTLFFMFWKGCIF